VFQNRVHNGRSRSFKVVGFGTNRKRVCDFLLVINSNLGAISPRFGDIAGFLLTIATSSVAMGGHVPTLPRLCWVMRFAQILSFLRRGGGGRWRTDSATNLRRTAFDSCKLFVYYIWFQGLRPRPTPGLRPRHRPRWGLPCLPDPCVHPDFRAWLRH